MKIFYKKDYETTKKDYETTKKQLEKCFNWGNLWKESYIELNETSEELKRTINEYGNEISKLNILVRKLRGSKGGYTAKINKQAKEIEELKKKLEESMTDKYLVRKLKPQKAPKTQITHIKSNAKTSRIIKKMYE